MRARPRLVVAALLALALLAPSVGPAAVAAPARARVTGTTRLSARLQELLVRSRAVDHDVQVRLLLPSSYRRDPTRKRPVLWLLHGCCDDETSWTRETDVEALTARNDLIVVMPDAGPAGFYSDWYNGGAGGSPAWETFHLRDLLDLLEDRFAADRKRMAIAGLSMGGFGTMSYAARHPDLFAAAASFSGALDTMQNDPTSQLAVDGIQQSQGAPRYAAWGDPIADEVRWRAHNPVDLAPNLRGRPLFVATGNGTPGVYDDASTVAGSPIEAGVFLQSTSFADRLDALAIPFTRDFYGGGTHSWPYWERELHRSMPMLLKAIERPRPAPRSFTYRSGERSFAVWGWSFRALGSEPAFTDVAVAGNTIAITGRGAVQVTTPARYQRGERYRVGTSVVKADRDGRLTFTVDAGDTAERYTPGPDAPGPRPTGPPVKASIRAA